MNLPNRLTISRFLITVVFVAVMSSGFSWAFTTGLLLFIAASITDYLDGEIARSRNLITDFGKLMDPLADKVMMAAAFICLVPQYAFPAWVAIIIIAREFLITGLRLLAANKGVVLPAERMGKHKTIWQIVTVIFFLLMLSLAEVEQSGLIHDIGAWWSPLWKWGGGVLIAWATVLTIYSGFGYLWKNRALIATH